MKDSTLEVTLNDELYWVAKDSKSVAEVISYLADTFWNPSHAEYPLRAGIQYAMLMDDYKVVALLANVCKKLL